MKTNNFKYLVGIILLIIMALGSVPFYDKFNNIEEVENKEAEKESEVTSINVGVKKGAFILDPTDAKNYIDLKVPVEFPRLRNLYFTSIDLVTWQMSLYPDFKAIGSHDKDLLHASFCLANNVSASEQYHIGEIFKLLITWNIQYLEAFTEINQYLMQYHALPSPDRNKVQELCAQFDEYPVPNYKFLYTGAVK
jgi:hypothetical protein